MKGVIIEELTNLIVGDTRISFLDGQMVIGTI